MRSALHDVFGDPAEVLHLAEVETPTPGPGKVRVRTLLAPIHNHDLWTVRGQYGYKPPLPGAIGGTEAVGIVDAVGDGVDAALVGKRVTVVGVNGTWAEYFLAPAASLIPVPAAIPDEAAAQLIAMPFSAVALLEFLGAKSGDWIVQNTANGAVGKVLAMLAQARSVNVINLVRRDAGVAELEALGIANAVSTAAPEWKAKVRALTGGAKLIAGVDSVGGAAASDLLDLIGDDGLLVSFGSMTGEPMQVPSGPLIFKQITIKGFWMSKVGAAMSPADRARAIGELIGLVAKGDIKLPVEGVFALADITAAVKASLTPGKSGKVLLKP